MRPFEKTELFDVMRRMDKDKAPEPDRFSLDFFQTCWDMLKEDLMKVFHKLYSFEKFEKSLNATFIALTPRRVRF